MRGRRSRRRGRGNRTVRRSTDSAHGTLRFLAGVGLAVPHRLRHPVKVAAVDEDTRTSTSVEADRLACIVERDGHQRHANHALRVEVVTHARLGLRADIHRVDEAVVDPLDRKARPHDVSALVENGVDRDVDDLLDLGSDVLGDFGASLVVGEIGTVEDLNCQRVDAAVVDLTVLHAVHRSEPQNIVPREARLGRTCVDAIDIPLLVAHTLHQAFPCEGLRGEAKRTIQQRRGCRLCCAVDDEGRIGPRNQRKRELGAVVFFDTHLSGLVRGLLVGRALVVRSANLERADDLRQHVVVVHLFSGETQGSQRIALARALLCGSCL